MMSRKEYSKHIGELRAAGNVISEMEFSRIILDDSPDIIVELKDGRNVGIEVVYCSASSIDSKSNNMRVSNNIKIALDTYKKQLIQKGELPMTVFISWYEHVLSIGNNINQKEFVSKFIEEIERHRRNDEIYYNRFACQSDKSFYKRYLDMAQRGEFRYRYVESVKCSPSFNGTHVIDRNSFMCGDIRFSDIEPIIIKKNDRLDYYKLNSKNQYIDEYWLVINVPYEEHMWIDDYKQDVKVVSGYERIYLTKWEDCKRIK